MLGSNQRPPPCKGENGCCRALQPVAKPAYLSAFLFYALPCVAGCCAPGGVKVVSGAGSMVWPSYEGAALSVRFDRMAIFSARRSSASRSSSGRRTMKEQSRPASTRAIQSKLQVEHRKSVPPSACSKASPIEGSCQWASSDLISSSTSTDHSSPGVLTTALSTASG